MSTVYVQQPGPVTVTLTDDGQAQVFTYAEGEAAAQAQASASAAASSASAAATSATNAANSAASIVGDVAEAEAAATAASGSASAAATSATNAGNSASAAATSATNAGNSASAAATSETNAGNSASAAATSATNAGNSASAAATSETNAATSATNAGNSASAAATSATNAATSETNAGNSAAAASDDADIAASAKTDAEAARDLLLSYGFAGNAYNTKAALTAALGSHNDGDYAVVLVDESQSNEPTVYQRQAGAWVFILTLAGNAVAIADVTGLQAALDAKLDDSQASAYGLSLIDDADAAAARTTLGLGTAAVAASGDFASSSHSHTDKAPLDSPALTGTPTAPTATAGTNTTQLATTAFVKTAVDALVAAAPGALDTLDELAAALGDDANFATTVTNALATKAASASPTLTGDIQHNGSQRGQALAVAASDIDCSTGNYFTKTVNGATTFTFSNVPAGAYGFVLRVDHTSGALTWPASVQPPKGGWPTLTTGKKHVFIFTTDDTGTTWRGAVHPDYAG